MSSNSATCTPKKSAETALQDSIAAADARQTPTISMVPLRTLMISAARCRSKRIECSIMIKAALAEVKERKS